MKVKLTEQMLNEYKEYRKTRLLLFAKMNT